MAAKKSAVKKVIRNTKRAAQLPKVPGVPKLPPPKKIDSLATKFKLSIQEVQFCEAYLQNRGNATLAAEAAGYGKTYGARGQQGAVMLKNPRIMGYINHRGQAMLEKMEITTDLLAAEAAKIAFSNIKDFVQWDERGFMTFNASDEISDVASAAISEVARSDTKFGENFKFKLHDKMRALDFLARLKGFMVDKHEHEAGPGITSLLDLANKYGMPEGPKDKPE